MVTDVRDLVPERLETLLLARLASRPKKPKRLPTGEELGRALRSYAPPAIEEPRWRQLIDETLQQLRDRQLLTVECRLSDPDELKRRIGPHKATDWRAWSERLLPGLALGISPGDGAAFKRTEGRDGWCAAIAGRVLGLWPQGAPPSPVALGDALVTRELGLTSAARKTPPWLRAHFLRKHVAEDATSPDQLLRLLAVEAIGAPNAGLKAIHAGLIQMWLTGRTLGTSQAETARSLPHADAAGSMSHADAARSVPRADAARPVTYTDTVRSKPHADAVRTASLVEAVRTAAQQAREGVFGERKVFISSVWNAIRAMPSWSALPLEDFKANLVAAHRKQELTLARADLVAAMDPALVASSETRTDGATFHFVVREPNR